jgi:acetyl esterase
MRASILAIISAMADIHSVRRRALGHAIEGFFRASSALGRLHPWSRRALQTVEIQSDIAYGEHPQQHLDVYSPKQSPAASRPLPALMYVHGGGFRILSKQTHWLMALIFARAGYVVFSIDYRLAPKDPFPAALEDCSEALRWLTDRAPAFGADPTRLVLAGESAGANLITALTLCCCQRRPEPYAAGAYESGLVPRVVLPMCGIHEVSQPTDALRNAHSRWMRDRIEAVSQGYLGAMPPGPPRELADPLRVLERDDLRLDRPLPAFFSAVGGQDPLVDDTRRLHRALLRRGAHSVAEIYRGEVHAFHAFLWRIAARQLWRAMLAFTDEQLR